MFLSDSERKINLLRLSFFNALGSHQEGPPVVALLFLVVESGEDKAVFIPIGLQAYCLNY